MLSQTPEGRADRTRFPTRLRGFADPGPGLDRPHCNRQGPARAGLLTVQEEANYSEIFKTEMCRNYAGVTMSIHALGAV